jgi:hypothetical protein
MQIAVHVKGAWIRLQYFMLETIQLSTHNWRHIMHLGWKLWF